MAAPPPVKFSAFVLAMWNLLSRRWAVVATIVVTVMGALCGLGVPGAVASGDDEDFPRRAKILGVVAVAIVGLITVIGYRFYLIWALNPVRKEFGFDGKELLLFLLPSVIFPCVGWVLGAFGSSLDHGKISSVLIMSVATVVGLLVSLLVWMELSVVTLSLFHF
ncbi:hypothetical protein [Cutibacterium modestum]|uniref:hypothetical protein n=1 Tax=Cutibacterium modestum TaxID=2559073 RepID=UPI001ABDA7E2|nr:hypothetical protein [Cutibacterium modestum]